VSKHHLFGAHRGIGVGTRAGTHTVLAAMILTGRRVGIRIEPSC
jgi:hypothetical protein